MSSTPIIEIIDDSSILDDTDLEIISLEEKTKQIEAEEVVVSNHDGSQEISVPFIDDATGSQPTIGQQFSETNFSDIIVSTQSHTEQQHELNGSQQTSQTRSSSKRILDDIISDDLTFSTDDISMEDPCSRNKTNRDKRRKSESPREKNDVVEPDSQESINENICSSPGRHHKNISSVSKQITKLTRSISMSPSKKINSAQTLPLAAIPPVQDKQLFIPESSEADIQVSTQPDLEDRKQLSIGEPILADPIVLESTANDINIPNVEEENMEFQRLKHYIINAETLTDQESKNRFQNALKSQRAQFKNVNQIPRDMFKARESIIIEFTPNLLETFKNEVPDIEDILAPATIQKSRQRHFPLIRFFRKCESIYDYAHDYYFPSELRIIEENVSIFYYSARDFFKEYKSDKRKLFESFKDLKSFGHDIILILHDLNAFKKELDKIEDNKYRSRVQSQIGNCDNGKSSSRQATQSFDYDMKRFDIEQRIRYIDREWGVKVHTINSHMEFLTSLTNLASLIGKKRTDPAIRFMRYAHLNIKSANDRKETMKKIFQEIGRVPEAKATSISNAYPDFQSLLHDFQIGSLKAGLDGNHLMTEKLENRLYRLFTSTDPNEGIE